MPFKQDVMHHTHMVPHSSPHFAETRSNDEGNYDWEYAYLPESEKRQELSACIFELIEKIYVEPPKSNDELLEEQRLEQERGLQHRLITYLTKFGLFKSTDLDRMAEVD